MTGSPVGRLAALLRRGDATNPEGEPEAAEEPVAGADADPSPGVGTSLLAGATGGLLGTAVMTAYRLPVFRALPPTAELWAQYVGGDAEGHTVAGLLLHLVYGAAGGAAFGPAYAAVASRLPVRRDATGMVGGSLYGAGLSAFGARVVFERLLGRELDRERALVFHAGHVVYGLTLGTWLGTRERRGDVYDEPSEHADR